MEVERTIRILVVMNRGNDAGCDKKKVGGDQGISNRKIGEKGN